MTLGIPRRQHRETLFSYELRALRVGRALLELTHQQADLLYILYRSFGNLVSNDDLVRGLYGQCEPEHAYSTIRWKIHNLRKVFEYSGSAWAIITVHGKGMILVDRRRYSWP